mmetsp:Transcript_133820/g.338105  ORF Transcript_133820/g.338105 Transcript_133820/m.338105 type:complete len:254 (+) Transcript_133820:1-762(+)
MVAAPEVEEMAEGDAALKEKMRKVHWVAFESNPDMFNQFSYEVGMSKDFAFHDILGLDDELLMMIPPGCLAVTLLFDSGSEIIRKFKVEQREQIEKDGQKVAPGLKYMRQYVGNACGTIATIHSLANNAEALGVAADSKLGKFLADADAKSPEEIGAMLADATELHKVSESSAQGGQTAAPEADADIHNHFITFVEKDGDVYELDGNKAFPINHGPAEGGLLKAAGKVIQANWIQKDMECVKCMIALAPGGDD